MKFFTAEAYKSNSRQFYEAYAPYKSYLETLKGTLPERVLELATLRGVDDGLLVQVEHDRKRQRLRLILRCGDLQMGYYDLVLTYHGAVIGAEHDQVLASIARSTKGTGYHPSDLRCYELDISDDGSIVQRFIFYPGIWFEISCKSLEWESIPRPNRKLPVRKDRYCNAPVSATT